MLHELSERGLDIVAMDESVLHEMKLLHVSESTSAQNEISPILSLH